MKTLFAILLCLFVTATAFATDRRPTVTLSGNNNYDIVIDGHRYPGNHNFINISNLRNGRHTIKVYEFRRGLFGSNRRLISSRDFILRNNDLSIVVDRYGDVQVYESRYDRGRNYDRNNGWGRDDDRDRNKGWNNKNKNHRGRDRDWNDWNRGRNKGY